MLRQAAHELAQAGCDTPRLDAELLLAHSLGRERSWLLAHGDHHPSPSQQARFRSLLERRRQREPVAYLLGRKEFYGLTFEVQPPVLIPRPETETLVERAITTAESRLRERRELRIVDVGTGSGCIAVSLAYHLPRARILGTDIEPRALLVARRNASRHGVAERVAFAVGDLLRPVGGGIDMIVSNPPYLSPQALAASQPEVQRFEPRCALLGGRDGLEVIAPLLQEAAPRLRPDGALLVEIASDQPEAAMRLARDAFPGAVVEVLPDLAGRPRLIEVLP